MNLAMHNTPTPPPPSVLHEAWALAGLMRGRYGREALPLAIKEAETETDTETLSIWRKVVDCLNPPT